MCAAPRAAQPFRETPKPACPCTPGSRPGLLRRGGPAAVAGGPGDCTFIPHLHLPTSSPSCRPPHVWSCCKTPSLALHDAGECLSAVSRTLSLILRASFPPSGLQVPWGRTESDSLFCIQPPAHSRAPSRCSVNGPLP